MEQIKLDVNNPDQLRVLGDIANAGIALYAAIRKTGMTTEIGSDVHIAMCQIELYGGMMAKLFREQTEKANANKQEEELMWICKTCQQANYSSRDAICINQYCPTHKPMPDPSVTAEDKGR